MSGFNFGQIENIISKYMDTDFIDIKRNITGQLQEIYSNIPCHVQIASTDNPNPESSDIKPINQSLIIHINQWVDIRNDDYIVAKKISNNGELLMTYSGRCGELAVEQGRKKVSMQMTATEAVEPTPIPPSNSIEIQINYISDNKPIQNNIIEKVEKNSIISLIAPIIEGYKIKYIIVDNEVIESDSVSINVGEENHTIKFIYEVSDIPEIMRILLNGLYTKDDGSLANGYHLYKKININDISINENIYTISCSNIKWIHDDNGSNIELNVGTKLILIPGNIFVRITSIDSIINDIITFNAQEFIPTNNEKNAYITGWYD